MQAIEGGMEGVRRVEQRPISVGEAQAAKEVFFVGSTLPVMSVVQVGMHRGERAGRRRLCGAGGQAGRHTGRCAGTC